jgi:lysophospholipase L1-like esterase
MLGVVIGDSIAQGYPDLGSRLNRSGDPTYDSDYPNITGQFSTEFSRLFGFHFYNHGISGQTTAQVWARWRRDVLGEVYDPGDGRGSQTLPGKADFVYVDIGVNDLKTTSGLTVTDTENNLLAMAQSCITNNIPVIFSNIAFRSDFNETQHNNIIAIDNWMINTLIPLGIVVFDQYKFSLDVNNPNQVRFEYYADDTHPNKAGYNRLARMAYETYINSL